MTQSIDPIKLRNAAIHLEWVLEQYPDSDEVQALRSVLLPLIEAARAGSLLEPIEKRDVPGAYNFSDGIYIPYVDPSVDDAYTRFRTELSGGLTEQEKRIMDRMRLKALESKP